MVEPIRIASIIESEVLKHMARYDLAEIANGWVAEHKEAVGPNTVGICYVPFDWKIEDGPIASKLMVRGVILRFTLAPAGEIKHEPIEQVFLERELPRVNGSGTLAPRDQTLNIL